MLFSKACTNSQGVLVLAVFVQDGAPVNPKGAKVHLTTIIGICL